jgi:DNA-binding NarL/FixJ family response regulator
MPSRRTTHVGPTGGRLQIQVLAASGDLAPQVAEALERAGVAADVTGRHAAARFPSPMRPIDVVIAEATGDERLVADAAKALPSAHVVAVVEDATVPITRRLLEAGASGVVDHARLPFMLPAAVRGVVAGLVCVPGSAGDVVLPPALSTRERQVLAQMAGGLSNAEIAERLYLSESTVKSHAASAFRRLGVRSRREAVALVLGSSEALRRSVLMSHLPDPPGDQRGH